MVDTGEQVLRQSQFRIENFWLVKDGFHDLIQELSKPTRGNTNIDRWQNRLRMIRKHLKGWHIDMEGESTKNQEGNFG